MPEKGELLAGKYRLVAPIGRGGMGEVHEAEHEQLGKRVAVKFLHPEVAKHAANVRRFTREAKSAAAIGHPSIIDVYDIETTPDASRVLAIALCGCGVEEVHLVGEADVEGAVVHEREAALLGAFEERVAELDPDVLLGWNVVDFDLRVLERRGRELHVPLALGREPGAR